MDRASWERARQILVEAQAVPPEDREAFVRRTCSDSPDLWREILPLLEDPGFPTHALPPAPDAGPHDRADLVPGVHVGPYVIVDRIGFGGMGEVFLATDPALRRRVALKCLLASGGPTGLERARILNEAIAAAAISHANVATIHHVVEEGDRAFIVMEYVEGENLAAKLRRERLPVKQVLRIARQLAAALRAAHEKGVIHRDIKPGNIQIRTDGSVKVLDFGVARSVRGLAATSHATTTMGARSQPALPMIARGGTPAYMSPEQIAGGAVDERSDLYSFGVVLFEMATGRRPFWTNESEQALVDGQREGAPRADAIQPDVPRALAAVIARALESNPAARYQSAAELEGALEDVERGLVSAPPLRERMVRLSGRAAIAAPVAVAVLGAIGFVATIGFNKTFGRTGAFGEEPWLSYVTWGALAVFPSAFVMTAAAVIVLAARVVIRAMEQIGPIGRAMQACRSRARRIAIALRLDRPAGLAQALTLLAVATLALLCWINYDTITAWGSFVSTAPIHKLLPIGESSQARLWYNVEFDLATLAFGFGLVKAVQLRRRATSRDGGAALAALAGVIVIMVLMDKWPYRTFSHRDFERADLAGTRCYILGHTAEEWLLFCPDTDPPRNRTVRRDDAAVHRTGVMENVFTGMSDH